jgi:hypothetical protein
MRTYLRFMMATITEDIPVKWAWGGPPLFYENHTEESVEAEARKVAGLNDNDTTFWGTLSDSWGVFPKRAVVCAVFDKNAIPGYPRPGTPCVITSEPWNWGT